MIALMPFLFGLTVGLVLFWGYFTLKKGGFFAIGNRIIKEAERQAKKIEQELDLKLQKEAFAAEKENEKKWQIFVRKMQKEEGRIKERERVLEKRIVLVDHRTAALEEDLRKFATHSKQLEEKKKELATQEENLISALQQLAGFDSSEAQLALFERLEKSLEVEQANRIQQSIRQSRETCESKAKQIVATAISRLSISCVSELLITPVLLPNDAVKGRIIGREGRNIRLLEQLCGVNLIMDDTPGTIVISGFDPIRKEVAKQALQKLIGDGRIHPTRIEEVVLECQEGIEKQLVSYGEEAAFEACVFSLHSDLIMLLGKLKFRTSVGQNVLKHSIEVSQLMGLMALELNLDAPLAKRIGLLHDIGKALPLGKEVSHAIAGHDFALKCGEDSKVANGIGAHHGEMESTTIEGYLVAMADALSGGRSGARSVPLEKTFTRMKQLEELSLSFEGVIAAHAVQAGKELRVIVSPSQIDDAKSIVLARNLAKKIEEKISHPGKIKITVLRQARAVSYAL
ncbi:MAG: ribonuclease Y [Chlamydiia bacterium]|nr:ribonuclease Y [Chlamydiia bacterium]